MTTVDAGRTRPRQGFGAVLVLLGAVALLLGGCSSEPTYADAEAGQCVREGSANGDDMSVVACEDAEARWTVLAQVDSGGADACADQVDADIVITDPDGETSTCLRFQAVEGDCVWTDLSGYADCDEDAGLQLATILTGATDATGCPAETHQNRVYSDGVVYCWVQHSP